MIFLAPLAKKGEKIECEKNHSLSLGNGDYLTTFAKKDPF